MVENVFEESPLETPIIFNLKSSLTPPLLLQNGQELVKELGISFNDVYKRTNTSYKPYPSGNSDYKSASSVERIEAFIALGVDDPVQYEDETGEVEYSVAKAHVEKLLAEYA